MAENVRVVVCSRFAVKFPRRKRDSLACWRDPDWIDYRVKLFARLTLHSFMHQTLQDFDIVLKCCEESRPFVEPYAAIMRDVGVQFVFDEGRSYLQALPTAIDTIHYIRIDSDDMYATTALATMSAVLREHTAVQCVKGYWWNVHTGDVRYWRSPSPPFYGLRRTRDRLHDLLAVYDRGDRHRHFRRSYKPRIDASGLFMVVNHEQNHSGRAGATHGTLDPVQLLPTFGVTVKEWLQRGAILPGQSTCPPLQS